MEGLTSIRLPFRADVLHGEERSSEGNVRVVATNLSEPGALRVPVTLLSPGIYRVRRPRNSGLVKPQATALARR